MVDESIHVPVAIIGGGPAGLTAALYAGRASLEPFVFAGSKPGGQLMLTSVVENYPGFPEGIQGPILMQQMRTQAERFGGKVVDEDVTSIDVSSLPFRISSASRSVSADALIIATGAANQWLNLPNELRLIGHGVSSCATCDGFFFKGKDVAVVGGGDSAMEEALFLTKFVSHVTIIHRRAEFRASQIMQEKVRANGKISIMWNSEVIDVLGDDHVSGVRIANVADSKAGSPPATQDLAVSGLFVAIGHVPATDVFKDHLELDAKGYVVVHDHTRTSLIGVFACGDVHDAHYRQAITAAGLGAMAALDVEKYLRLGKA